MQLSDIRTTSQKRATAMYGTCMATERCVCGFAAVAGSHRMNPSTHYICCYAVQQRHTTYGLNRARSCHRKSADGSMRSLLFLLDYRLTEGRSYVAEGLTFRPLRLEITMGSITTLLPIALSAERNSHLGGHRAKNGRDMTRPFIGTSSS
jgi:hypothetical protein